MNKVGLVGIVNVTPDSFSDGNLFFEANAAVTQIKQLFTDGASLVDIGAESTRPNAVPLTPAQEWLRLEPVIASSIPLYPNKLSLDTYHPETIERAARLFGRVFIANDVTGFNNPDMTRVVAEHRLACIISHLPHRFGTDIQAAHQGPLLNDIAQVKTELLLRHEELVAAGVPPTNIILDPGIGFGKTPELNAELLRFAALVPEYTVMIGYSRKRFLGEQRYDIATNLAAGRIAADAGAAYLRVHDVAAHKALV